MSKINPQDIYSLVSYLVEGTDVKITLPLIYRVVLWVCMALNQPYSLSNMLYIHQRAVLEEMNAENINPDNFWTEVNKKISWVREEAKQSHASIRDFLEVIYANDQDLYGVSAEVDNMGIIQQSDGIQAPLNIERNVEDAMRTSAKGKSKEQDVIIDPLLYGPLRNPSNSFSIWLCTPHPPSTPGTSEFNVDDPNTGLDMSFNADGSDVFTEATD